MLLFIISRVDVSNNSVNSFSKCNKFNRVGYLFLRRADNKKTVEKNIKTSRQRINTVINANKKALVIGDVSNINRSPRIYSYS